MQSEFFKWEITSEKVGYLTLTRPKLHNAFNDQMINSLYELFTDLKNADLRVIVIKGEGKSFCAGADLNWMKSMKDYSMQENVEDSLSLQKMFDAINDCPIPTIGLVHGAALGGGSGLVSCLDYVIAEENTKFGFTEVKLGLLPAVISPFVMAKIGYSPARALFTTGERFMAKRALEIGLIHRVESEENMQARLEKVVGQFLSAGPLASQKAKELSVNVNRLILERESCSKYTRELIAKTRVGSEAQEGMLAMLDKRAPNWSM